MAVGLWDNLARQTDQLGGTELRRSLRLVTLGASLAAAFFGMTGGTALPEMADLLGAEPKHFGWLGAIPFAAAAVQLPVSWIVEHTRRRKWLFITCVGLHRALYLIIAALPFLLPAAQEWRGVRLSCLLATFFMSATLACVSNPTWWGWMADMIPSKIRGRYWAHRRRMYIVVSIPSAIFAGWFIDYATGLFPQNPDFGRGIGLAVVIALGAIAGVADILLFMFIPEIPKPPREHPLTVRNLVATPLRDVDFRRYVLFSALITFATAAMMGPFVQRNAREVVQMTNWQTNLAMIVAPQIGAFLAVGWWGRARDRWGNRPVLVLGTIMVIPLAAAWVLATPNLWWIGPLITMCGGAAWVGIEIGSTNILMDFAGGGKMSSYQAVNSIVAGIGGFCGPFLAAWVVHSLADWRWQIGPIVLINYHVLFILSSLLRIFCVPLARRIHEPQARRTSEVLRFLVADIYSGTRSAVFLPARVCSWPLRLFNGNGNGH